MPNLPTSPAALRWRDEMPDAPRPGRIEFRPSPTAEVLLLRQALREILACCRNRTSEPLATIGKIAEEALK